MKILLLAIVVALLATPFAWAATLSQEAISYHKQAEEALKRGDIDGGITFYQKTIALDNTDALAHNILGVLYEGRSRLELSEEEYLKALSLEPKYADALINLARLYEKTNRKEKAVELLEKFLTFAPPKDKRVPEVKSKLLELTSPSQRKSEVAKRIEKEAADKLAKEIAQQKQALKKENEKKSQSHFSSGRSYYDKKQYASAVEEFKAALNYNPKNQEAAKYIKLGEQKIKQAQKQTQGEKKKK